MFGGAVCLSTSDGARTIFKRVALDDDWPTRNVSGNAPNSGGRRTTDGRCPRVTTRVTNITLTFQRNNDRTHRTDVVGLFRSFPFRLGMFLYCYHFFSFFVSVTKPIDRFFHDAFPGYPSIFVRSPVNEFRKHVTLYHIDERANTFDRNA